MQVFAVGIICTYGESQSLRTEVVARILSNRKSTLEFVISCLLCLSPFSLAVKNTIDGVSYKQQFWRPVVQDEGAGRFSAW